MGGSLGAFEALSSMLASFAASGRGAAWAGLLVMHMLPYQPRVVAPLLATRTGLRFRDAHDGDALVTGEILVATPDRHLVVLPDRRIALDDGPAKHFHRPSIDVLFESAARELGNSVISVLLSGADDDGVNGLLEVASRGGMIGVQQPDSATASTMPAAALAACVPNCVAPPQELGRWLGSMVELPWPSWDAIEVRDGLKIER